MPFDHFSFIAPIYARLGEYSGIEEMKRYADLPVEGRLLDIGGGTGRIARALSSFTGLTVVADVSTGMLRFTRDIEMLVPVGAAAENLPFADESFARVIMVDALHHVMSQQHSTLEMWRVLQLGGRLVIVEPDIRSFGVKLIALGEKLLLMRSHFLNVDEIMRLFEGGSLEAYSQDASIWVIAKKTVK